MVTQYPPSCLLFSAPPVSRSIAEIGDYLVKGNSRSRGVKKEISREVGLCALIALSYRLSCEALPTSRIVVQPGYKVLQSDVFTSENYPGFKTYSLKGDHLSEYIEEP